MAKIVLFTSYDLICLGIRNLSSVLKEAGHDVKLVFFKKDSNAPIKTDSFDNKMYVHYLPGEIQGCNYDINPYSEKEEELLRNLIKGFSPDIIGLSTRSFWLNFGKDLMAKIRQDNPQAITIAGGYGPSIEPEEFSKQVDYIVFGEGEKAIKEIAKIVDQKQLDNIKKVNNVGFQELPESFQVNPPNPPIKNLDALPFPDWIDKQSYYIENNELLTEPTSIRNVNWYDLFGCRGCPSNCSYCMAGHWNKLYRRYGDINFPKLRIRSPRNVISELVEQKKRNPSLEFIRFMDSIFSSSVPWLNNFLPEYKEKINLPFFCNIEVRFQSIEVLNLLCRAGMAKTSIGIQSGSNQLREKVYQRKISNKSIIEAANFLKQNGVKYQQDLIGFNPFDTFQTLKETFDLLFSMPPSKIVVFKLEIFPNSNLSKLYLNEKPKDIGNDYHKLWIYLWHLASYGGRHRKYANSLVSKYKTEIPIQALQEVEGAWLELKNVEPEG